MALKVEEELWFFVYLLEHYAQHKGRKTGDVLKEWDEHGITDEIYDGYFQYHQERIENAYEDIDSLLATGKHACYSGTSPNIAELLAMPEGAETEPDFPRSSEPARAADI